jgi:predicted DNA-binding transcriptional regulator AlpA
MKQELQPVLAAAQTLPLEQLPALVGGLAEIQAVAMARLAAPIPQPPAIEEANSTLDVEETAAYIGMSAKWVYRHQAILPSVRIGFGRNPRLRFRRADLDSWLQEHRTKRH